MLASTGCLPDLDPRLLETRCEGGASDGSLDPGEECDDGNEEDGDGCSLCRVECEGKKDENTFHCYFATPAKGTAETARDACRVSGAALVTLRSDHERTVALSALAQGAEAHTAYVLGTLQTQSTMLSFAAPDPISVYREPGVLLASDPLPLQCSGCYGASGLSFTAPGDRLVLGASGFRTGAPGELLPGLCERIPAGSPKNLCPGAECVSGAAADLRIRGKRYAYVSTPAPYVQAEQRCRDLGGHVVFFESEDEREEVLRHFSFVLSTEASWLGLTRGASGWVWSDGVPDGQGRPKVWGYEPLLQTNRCAVIQHLPGSFSTGLALPIPCTGKVTQPAVDGSLPYLCKLP